MSMLQADPRYDKDGLECYGRYSHGMSMLQADPRYDKDGETFCTPSLRAKMGFTFRMYNFKRVLVKGRQSVSQSVSFTQFKSQNYESHRNCSSAVSHIPCISDSTMCPTVLENNPP